MHPSQNDNASKTWLLGLCSAAALAGCGKEATTTVVVPPPPQAAVPAAAPASAVLPAPGASEPSAASAPAPPALAASTDLDNPTPLASRELKGTGVKQALSYYYSFSAPAGPIKITTVSKNSPSGATQALGFALYDRKANRLCFDSSGNTNSDKTVVLNCQIEKAQPLILRLDLSEETIDYSLLLDGTIELPAPQAASTATSVAGPGSTDIDEPTRLKTNRIKGEGVKKAVAYYYAFNAGPGELTLTIDGKNTSAGITEALLGGLYTLRSERLCQAELGNTTLEKRAVTTCKVDKRQPVILRLDLSAETVDFRARFDGPHDFDEYVAPKTIAIALDAAVLFDSGAWVLKPEARKTLDEAAARVKKFTDAPVAISGHTDSVGNDAANQLLSENRAAAVRDYFVNLAAVPAGRLSIKGHGKTQPVADNKTEEGRARNRRVDVVITPK
ncbi:OmpA family protein [Polaromonas sp.]|uniref:OmpA family protein n=1 Tax=Polaromonas sp. TaxID=1869339 RepID=UPI003263537C